MASIMQAGKTYNNVTVVDKREHDAMEVKYDHAVYNCTAKVWEYSYHGDVVAVIPVRGD
ncbi:MAG: hypothetical protein ACXAEN_24635 [Candidatus Thorarchaeota archaeon]|jgi:hypothetical protein